MPDTFRIPYDTLHMRTDSAGHYGTTLREGLSPKFVEVLAPKGTVYHTQNVAPLARATSEPRFFPQPAFDGDHFNPAELYVIAVVSNPQRYESRYRLYHEFAQHMKASGVTLITVEHAFGERKFEVTTSDNPHHVQLRGGPDHSLWLKEAMINAGVRRLPSDWKYLAWIDADIHFSNPNWAVATIHALQHHRVVQPWSHSVDLGPEHEVITNEWGRDVDRSFAAAWEAGDVAVNDGSEFVDGEYGLAAKSFGDKKPRDWRTHFGYAWAIRRDAFDGIGGLLDWMVTGSGDYHMAMAFAGLLNRFDSRMSPGYIRRLKEFAQRCERHIKQDIGVVAGTILHSWHGRKKQRGYISRFDVLIESGFDPDVDLAYDWQGLPTLNSDNRMLRMGLRKYFASRNEDSIDTL